MNSETKEANEKRLKEAFPLLSTKGFIHLGGWIFLKEGITYDLSVADLEKIDTIIEKQCFVKETWW